ncbi:MAG: hypothetical protein GY758_30585 [Fuerstiella sp.]|jgi:hypothetical protein|nr:hypothetical protein [Fuerstiella sp.]MCP4511548.1 hypothetical protein [Fuerstiella sp.]MDG2129578.1 hypothetical protein [Fuerstiella sp.]
MNVHLLVAASEDLSKKELKRCELVLETWREFQDVNQANPNGFAYGKLPRQHLSHFSFADLIS